MAKKTVVPKMTENDVPATGLSEVEQNDLATAAAANESGKSGEARPERLAYHPFSPELHEILRANSRGETLTISRDGLKAKAREKGSPLTPEDFSQWFGVDTDAPANACFVDHESGAEAPVAFRSVIMRDDGSVVTNEQYVTAENPTGIVWRGNFLRMPGAKGLEPRFVCSSHMRVVQGELGRRLKAEKGRDVAVPAQSYAQSLISIAAIRNRNQRNREVEQSTRDNVAAKIATLGGDRKPRQVANLGDRAAWSRSSRRRDASAE